MSGSSIRVGDIERDEAAQRLRDHCAAGRLSLDELDARLDGVYRAETRADIHRITQDLPESSPPVERSGRSRHLFWPGVAAFSEERHLRASSAVSYEMALRKIVPGMGMQGFHLLDEVPSRRLRFRSNEGLEVSVMFHPAADGGTDVSVFGEARRGVRKAFANLRD